MIVHCLSLALLLVTAGCLSSEASIDGVITVKLSNASGYDLWFPDGTYRYADELKTNFICNGMWYLTPYKPKENEFNVPGFLLVLAIALLATLVFTASFPMIFLSSNQNKFITKLIQMSLRKASRAEPLLSPEDDNVRKAMAINDEGYGCCELFSLVWMLAGIVIMFLISCVCANALLIVNGWPSTVLERDFGWCYELNQQNMLYSERPEQLDDSNSTATSPSDMSTAIVKIDHTGAATFFSKCGTAFFRPTEGANITWKLESPYKRVCEPVRMREMKGVTTNVWYEDSDDNPMFNGKSISGKCNYEYVKDKKEYNVRFASCCARGDGNPVPDDCDQKGSLVNTACMKALDIRDNYDCSYRVKTYEFSIQEMSGWQRCHYVQNYKGFRLYRNDKDVTSEYLISAKEDNSNFGMYPFGWLTADDGSRIVVLDQNLIAGDGLGYVLYWGNLTNEDWLKTHIDMGHIDLGWRHPMAVVPEFHKLSDPPPFTSGCQMTFTTKKEIANFHEFRTFCTNVWARLNNYNNVLITTESNETCSVALKGKILDKEVETVVAINKWSPVSIHLEDDMFWRCATQDDESRGKDCKMNAEWVEFVPENYSTDHFIQNPTAYDGTVGEPGIPSVPDPLSNIRDIFKYVGIAIGAAVGSVAAVLVGFKLLSLTACCMSRFPVCAMRGRGIFNCCKKYQPRELRVDVNLNSTKEAL